MAIEFDTFYNAGAEGNLSAGVPITSIDHVGFDRNGSVASERGAILGFNIKPTSTTSGNITYVWIEYDGSSDLMEVRVSQSSTRPVSATLSYPSLALETALTSRTAFFGFTASTGGQSNEHRIETAYFANSYLSGGIDPLVVTQATVFAVDVTNPGTPSSTGGNTTRTFTVRTTDDGGTLQSGVSVPLTCNNATISSGTSSPQITNGSAEVQFTITYPDGQNPDCTVGAITGGAFALVSTPDCCYQYAYFNRRLNCLLEW